MHEIQERTKVDRRELISPIFAAHILISLDIPDIPISKYMEYQIGIKIL